MKLYSLTNTTLEEISLPDMASLDTITRQLPQGFYSTFRTYAGGMRVIGLKAHLRRLYGPAEDEKIPASASKKRLRGQLSDLLTGYPDEARVRLILTYDGAMYIALESLKPLPLEIYQNGVQVITTELQRQTPRLKSTRFISVSETLRSQVKASHVFEALLVKNGRILEGMTSNFFYVLNGKLGTARRDVLLGVTRSTVLRVARGSGVEVGYRTLKREQVSALDEAFLTSSSRGIVPIVQIDEIQVGQGSPGIVTCELMSAYQEYVRRTAELI